MASWTLFLRRSLVAAWHGDTHMAGRWQVVREGVDTAARVMTGLVLWGAIHVAGDMVLDRLLAWLNATPLVVGTATLDPESMAWMGRQITAIWELGLGAAFLLMMVRAFFSTSSAGWMEMVGSIALERRTRQGRVHMEPRRNPQATTLSTWLTQPFWMAVLLWAFDPAQTARDEARVLDQVVPAATDTGRRRSRL